MLSRRRRFAMPFALSGALAAVSLVGLADPAHATPGPAGTASATTAEVGLDVRLLNSAVDIPVDLSLNKITAPGSKHGAALTAVVGPQVQAGQPINLLMAQVGETDATVDTKGSRASVNLVDTHVHLPGLPLTDLLGVHAVTAQADCPVNGTPTASAELAGRVTVFGIHVNLSVDGVTKVPVPLLGEVDLKLSQHSTTSDSAAATALELDVDVNPAKLNIAEVSGRIVLADVSCTKGSAGGSNGGGSNGGGSNGGGSNGGGANGGVTGGGSGGGSSTGGSATGGSSAGSSGGSSQGASGGGTAGSGGGKGTTGGASAHPTPVVAVSNPPAGGGDGGETHLAMTGSSSSTPVIAGAGLVVVAAGGGALALTRRRRRG